MAANLNLRIWSEPLAVCRLSPGRALPEWAGVGSFCSATWTRDELSIVCPAAQVPADVQAERAWYGFQVEGPLDFGLIGVILAIAAPLATANISIFAISTYDTDYVLVKQADLIAAVAALRSAGHRILE